MLPKELAAIVDPAFDTAAAEIKKQQDVVSQSRSGKYKQYLSTATVIPADGVTVLPDNADAKPTNEANAYPDTVKLVPQPVAITVNVYDGPQGKGYEVVGQVKSGKDLFYKVLNVGPETYRDDDGRRGWVITDVLPPDPKLTEEAAGLAK